MTGYMGRIGIYETLLMSHEMQASRSSAETDLDALQRPGLQGRHEAAADQRRDENRSRHDDDR